MGVKNDIFWSEIGSVFLLTGRHTFTNNSQKYSLLSFTGYWVSLYPLDPVKKAVTPGFCGK